MVQVTMRISLDNISEGGKKLTLTAYKKLSSNAKSIVELMAAIYNHNKQHRFTIDDIREHGLHGGWRKIDKALFELESRGFGTVRADENIKYFEADIPAIQSIP